MALLTGALLLALVITIHEFGHFVAARMCNVRVEEFNVGFGPILYKRTIGETQWALRVTLMGGYVRLHSSDDVNTFDPTSLSHKTFGQRLGIALAGPAINIATAILALTIAYSIGAGPSPTKEMCGPDQTVQLAPPVALVVSAHETFTFPKSVAIKFATKSMEHFKRMREAIGTQYIGLPNLGVAKSESTRSWISMLLMKFWFLSVIAGFFNLLPIPPLDGSKIWSDAMERFKESRLTRAVDRAIIVSAYGFISFELMAFMLIMVHDFYVLLFVR